MGSASWTVSTNVLLRKVHTVSAENSDLLIALKSRKGGSGAASSSKGPRISKDMAAPMGEARRVACYEPQVANSLSAIVQNAVDLARARRNNTWHGQGLPSRGGGSF